MQEHWNAENGTKPSYAPEDAATNPIFLILFYSNPQDTAYFTPFLSEEHDVLFSPRQHQTAHPLLSEVGQEASHEDGAVANAGVLSIVLCILPSLSCLQKLSFHTDG